MSTYQICQLRQVCHITAICINYFLYLLTSATLHFRFVTQLLKEIIFFVGDDQYNGGGKHGDPLDMEFTINDRERQKLLREQNILKQVPVLLLPYCYVSDRVSDFI